MNVCGDNLQVGWETEKETSGAWLELDFGAERPGRELRLLKENPEFRYYRMALFPHADGWRSSYREGFAFSYPLSAFVGGEEAESAVQPLPRSAQFIKIEPPNLVLTALKVCEDDDSLVLRFYEAEGFESQGRIHFARGIRQAWKTNLIDEEPETLPVSSDGTLELTVKPWEIVTLKVAM